MTPEHSGSVEAWTLTGFIGRRVWARPEDVADTTPARWVELIEVWMENDTGLIGFLIDWDHRRKRATHRLLGKVQVELTKDEFKNTTRRDLGEGHVIHDFDPHWGRGGHHVSLRQVKNRAAAPQPDPELSTVPTPHGEQHQLF